MITTEDYVERLKPLIRKGKPFLGYWHPHGHSVMLTGPCDRTEPVYVLSAPGVKTTWEYRRPQDADKDYSRFFRKYGRFPNIRKEVRQLKPLKVSKAGIAQYRRFMRKLESADPYTRTVEFDGVNLITHGGIDLDF